VISYFFNERNLWVQGRNTADREGIELSLTQEPGYHFASPLPACCLSHVIGQPHRLFFHKNHSIQYPIEWKAVHFGHEYILPRDRKTCLVPVWLA